MDYKYPSSLLSLNTSIPAPKRSFQAAFEEAFESLYPKRPCQTQQDLATPLHTQIYHPRPTSQQANSKRIEQWLESQGQARDGTAGDQRPSSAPTIMAGFTTSLASDTDSLYDSTVNYPRSSSATSRSQSRDPSGKQDLENYRDFTLADNGVLLLSAWDERPQRITELIEEMKKPRTSLQSLDYERLGMLENLFFTEEDVLQYLGNPPLDLLPQATAISSGKVKRVSKTTFSQHTVPYLKGSQRRVLKPTPDYCWGLSKTSLPRRPVAFNIPPFATKTSNGVVAPFLIAETKSDMGSLSEGMNQCLGGAASCVKIAEAVKAKLLDYHESVDFETTCFALTLSGTEARLFACWLHDDSSADNPGYHPKYLMQRVQSFAIQEPSQFLELRSIVHNILDWGAGTRLDTIRQYMDSAKVVIPPPPTSQKRKVDDSMPPPVGRGARST